MAPTETATRLELELPQPTAIVAKMAPIVALAQRFEVTDVESDRIAQQYEQELRRAERSWTDYCEPARKAADEMKKRVLALRDGILGPWVQARRIFSEKSIAYQNEQRRIAEEERRRLQEKARLEEEERQIAAAQEAQDAGDAATAEAIVSEPVSAPIIHVQPQIAQVDGVSSRTLWEPEITDARACIRALLDRPEWAAIWDRFIPLLVTILRPFVVAQRQAFSMPGVRAVSKTSRATR